MIMRFTLSEFADHLDKLATKTPSLLKALAEGAGKALETQAKWEIGNPEMYALNYVSPLGPSQPWPVLADSTEVQKAKLGAPGNSPLLRTGEMLASISYHVYGGFGFYTAVMGSIDPKMVYHEWGTVNAGGHTPPRPVISTAMFIRLPDILLTSRFALAHFIAGKHRPWGSGNTYHIQMGGHDSLFRG